MGVTSTMHANPSTSFRKTCMSVNGSVNVRCH